MKGDFLGIFNFFKKDKSAKNETYFDKQGNIVYLGDSDIVTTPAQALQISAVYACVRVISENISTTPLDLYKKASDGSREKQDNGLSYLLRYKPNAVQSISQLLAYITSSIVLRGGGFIKVNRKVSGEIHSLVSLNPDDIEVIVEQTTNFRLVKQYKYNSPDGKQVILNQRDVIHIPNLVSTDGYCGLSTISAFRETFGSGLAQVEHENKFYSNGAKYNGILQMDGKLSDAGITKLKKQFKEEYGGKNGNGKTLVLEEGLTFSPLTMSHSDAQFIESRRFTTEDIARVFNVPPHMIQDLSRATFSNIEEQSINFVRYTLQPYFVNIEQQFMNILLTPEDIDAGYFLEFNTRNQLRSTLEKRYDAYSKAIDKGWMQPNEARELENLKKLDGLSNSFIQLNMGKIDEDGNVISHLNTENTIEAGNTDSPTEDNNE